jgi:uncharacterized membrane protein YidH (DUF202 family)
MTRLSIIMYTVVEFLFLFYPLADIRWGRYKLLSTVFVSSGGSTLVLVAMVVLAGVASARVSWFRFFWKLQDLDTYPYPNTIQFTVIILNSVVFEIPALIAFLLIPCGLVCFRANVIQYGMDQLHDAPMEDTVLYGMSGQAMLDYCHWK